MPSSSSLIALALAVTTPATASPFESFSKVRSNKHDALISPSHKETKWLIFPQQQELHAQSVIEGSLRATHEKVSPGTFFKEHTAALGLDQEAVFTRKNQYGTNAITHEKYQQSVNNVPVFGGDFHLTVGSHDGGKCLLDCSVYSLHTVYLFLCLCPSELYII
jgi:hypothetical protein